MGGSLKPHVLSIAELLKRTDSKSLLDYGAGKGEGYKNLVATLPDGSRVTGLKFFWGIDEIVQYDPGFEPFSKLPDRQFDAVVSTDVLEHCPEEDIDWILQEIFSFSRKLVFCTVAVYAAKKHLPTGENAHITVKNPGWWVDKFDAASAATPELNYHLFVMHAGGRNTYIHG